MGLSRRRREHTGLFAFPKDILAQTKRDFRERPTDLQGLILGVVLEERNVLDMLHDVPRVGNRSKV